MHGDGLYGDGLHGDGLYGDGLHGEAQVVIPPRAPFVDERGEITNLVDAPFTSVAVIRSVKGSIRGNHYHKTDYHYCWLQQGQLIYFHREVGSDSVAQCVIRSGETFFTPPMHEHSLLFTEESVLFVFARNNREMENYEEDTVRVPSLVRQSPEDVSI